MPRPALIPSAPRIAPQAFGASADNFLLWFLTPLMQLSVFQWADAKDWPAWKRLLLGLALVPIQFGLLVILMGLLGPLMVAR